MPTNTLAPPDMPWMVTRSPLGQPNGLGPPPMLNYAAPPDPTAPTLGQGVAQTGANAWQWLQDQRAESVRQGLLDPETGLPTQKGLVDAARATAEGVMMGTTAPETVRLYHGTSPEGAAAIQSTGRINGPAYFTPDKAAAADYAGGGPVVEVNVPKSALKVDMDLPGGQLLSVEDANAYSGRENWTIDDYLNAGHSVGVDEHVPMGTTAPGIRAYHGSPHDFERFDTSKIGTGEGAQAYGHGLYFAEGEGVARGYRDSLSPPPTGPAVDAYNAANAAFKDRMAELSRLRLGGAPVPPEMLTEISALQKQMTDLRAAVPATGKMYEVNIAADPEHMLQWDQTIGTHPPAIRDKLLDMGYGDTQRGSDVYLHMARGKEGDVGASKRLQDAGIPGISYFDAGSRGAGTGTKNHVVFDAATIDILRKYGLAGLMLGGGAAAAGSQQQPPSQ